MIICIVGPTGVGKTKMSVALAKKYDAIISMHSVFNHLKSYEETGYVVITAEGLSKESWEEDKDYYMDMMCENIAYEISDAIKEFAPEIAEKEGKEMNRKYRKTIIASTQYQ